MSFELLGPPSLMLPGQRLAGGVIPVPDFAPCCVELRRQFGPLAGIAAGLGEGPVVRHHLLRVRVQAIGSAQGSTFPL